MAKHFDLTYYPLRTHLLSDLKAELFRQAEQPATTQSLEVFHPVANPHDPDDRSDDNKLEVSGEIDLDSLVNVIIDTLRRFERHE